MLQCPPIPKPDDPTLTGLARYAQGLIGQYNTCRLTHDELVDWARGTNGNQ